MRLRLKIIPRRLHFKQPAGTSRGVYRTHDVWYVVTEDLESGACGIGECAPLPDLSCDASLHYADTLRRFCDIVEREGRLRTELLRDFPSMLFGLECAMLSLSQGGSLLFDTSFARGERGILINGLVWMGGYDEMLARIDEKLRLGFRCVKLKIGAIDFQSELDLLRHIRSAFPAGRLELRVDANGAFAPDEALRRLDALSVFDLHSIEQPIRAGQWEAMRRLAASSPIPIALDEELIGINTLDEKRRLLDAIQPQYVVIKPSLHGGLCGGEEWIAEAEARRAGWWVTSALESNVGLNALAQWASAHDLRLPQGFGTGMLYVRNVEMPLEVRRDSLWTCGNENNMDIVRRAYAI